MLKTFLVAGALFVGASSTGNAAVLFFDSLQSNLSKWGPSGGYTGTAYIAAAPFGGKALTFGALTGGGDIQTLNSFTSGTGSFTISFDFLGACGFGSSCGGFVSVAPPGSWLVSDTPYGIPQFGDTGKWENVSYTFAGSTATIAVEDWSGSAHAFPGSVYFRNIELTDNPIEATNGTFTVSGVAGVPEPSTWAMMLFGLVGVGLLCGRTKNRTSASRSRVS